MTREAIVLTTRDAAVIAAAKVEMHSTRKRRFWFFGDPFALVGVEVESNDGRPVARLVYNPMAWGRK